MLICDLKYHWAPEFVGVVFTGEAVDGQNLSQSLWVLVTATTLHVVDAISDSERCRFDFMSYEFKSSEQDPTLIVVERPLLNARVSYSIFTTRRVLYFFRFFSAGFRQKTFY